MSSFRLSFQSLFGVIASLLLFQSCREELVLDSDYFIGKWEQEYQYWNLIEFEEDTILVNEFNNIEFYADGTSLQITPHGEFDYDWFYREIPKQIYFTKINQPWPSDELYDITEMSENAQTWERRIQLTPVKVGLYKYILTRTE